MKKQFLFAKSLTTLLFTGALTWGTISSVNSQVATNYNFSQTTGTYTPITGGTLLGTATPAVTQDDAVFTSTIPFNFVFDGNVQTSIFVSTNGFISFGATNPGTVNYGPISSTTAYAGVVSPFGRDLQGGYATEVTRTLGSNQVTVGNVGPITVGSTLQNTATGFPNGTTVTAIAGNVLTLSNNATSTGSNTMQAFYGDWSEIRVETLGSAPNQIFVVQWQNWRRFGTTATTSRDLVLNFQVRLYESDNSIEIVYGNCSPGTGTTFTTVNQVGLRGPNNTFATNVNNRLNVKGTNDNWLNSSVGTTNASGMLFNTAAPANVIPNGLTYRWELASCVAPGGLTASLVSANEVNVSWNTAVPAPGVGYEWAVTTSATPPANGTATAGLTGNVNTLNSNTNYWLHVRSECTAGVFSGWSTIAFNTLEGNTCALVQDLGLLTSPFNGTTVGYTNNFTVSCLATATAGDRVFKIDVPNNHTLFIGQSTNNYDSRHRIAWGGACPGTTEINTGYIGNFPTVNTTGTIAGCLDDDDLTHYSFNNQTGNTQTVYWVQDAFTTGTGTFTLEWQILENVPPPSCASNFVITPTPNCDNYQTTISWDAVPTATGYLVSLGTTPGGNQIANNFNIGNLTSVIFLDPSINTTYYYTITPYNIGGNAVGCIEQQFTTGSQQCACIPTYTFGKTAGDLISNVVIPGTTLSNNSGTAEVNPSFTYFTGQPNFTANLVQGGSYNVTVSIGTWGNQHMRAWIDYNDNGVFEASESIGNTIVASGQGFNAGGYPPAVFPVNLSLSAPLGTHRMRIRTAWQSVANPSFAANLDPCLNYDYGETEDYDITILAPITTQLQANFCNISNVTMDMPIRAINVNVPQYRFRIVGANNGGPGWNGNTFILDRNSRDMKFAFVPGSLWGTTYTIDVAAGDGFGNYGPYGATCTVSLLAAIPTTQLQASDCGAVNVDPAVNLLANTITSATGYRFQVNGPGVAQNTVITKTMGGGAMRKLKMQEVAGIVLGETYTVEVAIRDAAGNWGAYGNPCSVTLMGAPNVVINNNIEMVQNRNLSEVTFGLSASHNPFTTEFGLQVLNANDTETINVAIYDMSGKLIERHAVNPMDIEATTFGSNLASGMYMVEVRQGANQAVVRQVKN